MALSVEFSLTSDLGDRFIDLYSSVFDLWTLDGNCPYHVYLLKDDDTVLGFASGFAIGVGTWYLQRAGFIKSEQKRVSNIYRANFAIKEILKDWPSIMAFVSSEHHTALKLAMALDFKIIGTRIDTAKNLWVEFLRVKEN
jgi:hypothetical protein